MTSLLSSLRKGIEDERKGADAPCASWRTKETSATRCTWDIKSEGPQERKERCSNTTSSKKVRKKKDKNGGRRNHRVWRLQADNDWGHLPWRPNRTTVHGSRMTSKWNPVSLFVSCRYRACLRSDDGGRKSQMGKKPYVL